jgi:WD40 repeat protein
LSVSLVPEAVDAPSTLTLATLLPGRARVEARLTLPKTAGKKPNVAVSPDGGRVAVAVELPEGARGLRRSGVRFFALPGGEPVGELAAVNGTPPALAWSPDGRYIAGVLGAKLVVWSTEDGKPRGELEAGGTRLFCGPRFHPSGRFLAAGGANIDGGVYCWNVGTWEELVGYRWPVGPIACVNFSPDGTLAVTGGEKGRILVWDVDG